MKNKKSVFMQMHDGERSCEGSFNVGLQKLFYLAGTANKRKLVEAFPDFFGDEVPEFGITRVGLSGKKMNTHLHLKDATRQNLEESLRYSEEMISNLSPLIYEMLQKHQDDTQQDKNGQPCVFRFRIQFQKYDIEFSFSESREASPDATGVYDLL